MKKVSLRQSSQGGGGRPSRESRYQSVWCRCIMCGTVVRLTISQVSVVPTAGKASDRAGLKVFALIVQTGRKPPPIAIVQVRSGSGEAFRAQSGSGRRRRGTRD